jgi:hypothetical protein
MKITKLCLLALVTFLLSCSQAQELDATSGLLDSSSAPLYQNKESDTVAENLRNPFDLAGSLTTQLHLDYYHITSRDSSTSAIISDVVDLAHSNAAFQQLSSTSYSFTAFQKLDWLLTPSDSLLTESIRMAVSDVGLQSSLEDFIHHIMTNFANEDSYSSLYDEIIYYEDGIIDDTAISFSDKRVLLTITSVLRHKLKRTKKRPKKNTDRDWELMITTMGAAAGGAKDGLQNAIILSLLTELSQSN